LAKQAGVKIIKTSDGLLTYTLTPAKSSTAEYNTLEIPKGGQYGVCLPDGTKVWLNAASTLRYPATFSSLSERRVVLSGEAYFEVVHDKKQPFIVETAYQSVRDIGTKFNINSYAEEPGIKTTLLEGSAAVSLNPSKGGTVKSVTKQNAGSSTYEKVISAGQQAILKNDRIEIAKINADESISWKNGFFQFQNDDLKTGMRQLARWYNVEIVYEGPVPTEKLDGKVYRNINLSSALQILLGTDVSYTIENRKVTIMSNK
jgi:transmembrane sensor